MSGVLFAITDRHVSAPRTWAARAEALLEGVEPSRVIFGVRDHDASARERVAWARALISVARPRGARVIVHDRADVALVAGADGVHLAERSMTVREARRLLGAQAWIGRSCHDAVGLRRAADEGADGATLSPVFASPGKGEPLGLQRFAALRAEVADLCVIGLGGIDATNAPALLAAGADGVAVIRGWLDGPLEGWSAALRVVGGAAGELG